MNPKEILEKRYDLMEEFWNCFPKDAFDYDNVENNTSVFWLNAGDEIRWWLEKPESVDETSYYTLYHGKVYPSNDGSCILISKCDDEDGSANFFMVLDAEKEIKANS